MLHPCYPKTVYLKKLLLKKGKSRYGGLSDGDYIMSDEPIEESESYQQSYR